MIEEFTYRELKIKVIRKKIKHTYLRVNENKEVIISTSFQTKQKEWQKLVDQYYNKIQIMREKQIDNDILHLFGKKYRKIKMSGIANVEILEDKIFYSNEKKLHNWYLQETKNYFEELLISEQKKFSKKIPLPGLKIRKMKSRWGVCHRGKKRITLNLDLMRFEQPAIQYVIIHELAHFIYPNHSPNFWSLVQENCPDYQKLRKLFRT